MNTIESQKQQVDTLFAELTAHHWDEAIDLFAGDNPAFEDVPANARLTGKAGITRAYQPLMTAIPDLEIEVVSASDRPGCSIREIAINGTHLGRYQGQEPTGRRVRLACACFFQFDANGRLINQRIYFDNESLIRQMRGGITPYLPVKLRAAA